MKILTVIFIFTLGAWFGRWDAKHGAAWGYKLGTATRELFNLPPLGHNQKATNGGTDDEENQSRFADGSGTEACGR